MSYEDDHAQRRTDALEAIAKSLDQLVAELRAWRAMSAERSVELQASLGPAIAELAQMEEDVPPPGKDQD